MGQKQYAQLQMATAKQNQANAWLTRFFLLIERTQNPKIVLATALTKALNT
jgi:hypothetical protein